MGSSRLQRVGRVEDLVARALTRCCQHHRLRPFGPLAADRRPPTHGRARVGATWAGRRASGSVHNLRETVLGPGMLCTTRVRSMPCTEALHDVMGRATASGAAAGGDHTKTVGCGREAPHVGARLGKGWWLLAATSTPPCAATSGEGEDCSWSSTHGVWAKQRDERRRVELARQRSDKPMRGLGGAESAGSTSPHPAAISGP